MFFWKVFLTTLVVIFAIVVVADVLSRVASGGER
ncbi:hypothetical protein TAMC210_24960 [Thermanaeromonas sp. C210]|nr:hypothetical protein TAMC210_24960 [Thermanaeromonas sp. C210]